MLAVVADVSVACHNFASC